MEQGMNPHKTTTSLITVVTTTIGLLILPLLVQQAGNAWVRIIDVALLYVLLALGLNIVVGFAGLLDLGYVAFYAVGAYMFGLLASPQLTDSFPALAALFPGGLHVPWWLLLPLGAVLAAIVGVLLGAPTLKLRGDYLAIVTLGFGEIVRVFMTNLDAPVNITNGPRGISGIDEISFSLTWFSAIANLIGLEDFSDTFSLGKTHHWLGLEFSKVTNYY
jgi:branched-chain amino acid transport system permease protein